MSVTPEAAPSLDEVATFKSFGLKDLLQQGIDAVGFVTPTPIQAKVIPMILQGQDLVAQAQTGTGKTATFGLAALNLIDINKTADLLVMTPTRELCGQVAEELEKLGRYLGVKTVAIYGGTSGSRQIEKLHHGAQVVVATPGRLLDHLTSGRLKNFNPSIVVLDEADQMLDMGFIDDIKEIMSYLSTDRQTLLFSATMPEAIIKLSQDYLKQPVFVNVTKKFEANKNIEQWFHMVENHKRTQTLVRLIELHQPTKSIIFCKTKKDVEDVRESLTLQKGEFIHALHGDMEQRQRERVIEDFKNGKITILVATDVASRGINVVDISHVFNYHPPFDKENYIHRIGRTARAGRLGIAISLVSPGEKRKFEFLQKSLGQQIPFKTLPTKEEMRQSMVARLVQELESCKTNGDIAETLTQLDQIPQVKEKLISLFLKQRGFFQVEGFKELQEQDQSYGGSQRDFGKKRSYSEGGRRSFSDRDSYSRKKESSSRFGRSSDRSGSDRPARGEYKPRERSEGFSDRAPRGEFKPRERSEGSSDRAPRGEYKPRERSEGFSDRAPRGEFKPRERSEGFSDRAPRGEFKPRSDRAPRGEFKPREKSEGFSSDRPARADRYERSERPDQARGGFKKRFK